MSKVLIVNLYGGPGTGKSTTATGVFSKLKYLGYKCEYVSEFAKDLTYEKSFEVLQDNLFVIATQHHRSFILRDKVDIIITDSPLILPLSYINYKEFDYGFIKNIVKYLYDKYNTLDIFINRNNDDHAYESYGRSQTVDEAIGIDEDIKRKLKELDIKYNTVNMGESTIDYIVSMITNKVGDPRGE